MATTVTLTDQPALSSSVAKTTANFTNPAVSTTATQENDTTKFLYSTESDSTPLPPSSHTNDCHRFTSTIAREVIAWTLAATSTVLFIGSLTVNITVLWVYKKRQAKDYNVESRGQYEMEGNPCYEASNCVKQTTDTQKQEIHVYERVKHNKPE